MTTQAIIQAAPFNLGTTRPWTAYETAVIHQALLDGVAPVAAGAQEVAATKALAVAMALSPAFNSPFGPAPAVPVNWFYCVGQKWRDNRLDPGLVAAVQSGRIGPSFFGACETFSTGISTVDLFRHNDLYPWYGAAQRTTMMAPPDWISEQRSRTQYVATTGKQVIALLQRLTSSGTLRITLPPQLQQMIDMANSFPANMLMDRPITLAVALRDPAALQALLNIASAFLPMILAQISKASGTIALPQQAIDQIRQIVQQYIEDVVMIWAPGQGASLMPIVMGTADLSYLIGIGVSMGGGVPGGIPPQVTQVVAAAVAAVTGLLGGGKQPMNGVEIQTGPSANPMVTKTRAELLATALPAPPLPSGIVAISAPLVDDGSGPPPPDAKKLSPVALGAIAAAALLVVAVLVRGGSDD